MHQQITYGRCRPAIKPWLNFSNETQRTSRRRTENLSGILRIWFVRKTNRRLKYTTLPGFNTRISHRSPLLDCAHIPARSHKRPSPNIFVPNGNACVSATTSTLSNSWRSKPINFIGCHSSKRHTYPGRSWSQDLDQSLYRYEFVRIINKVAQIYVRGRERREAMVYAYGGAYEKKG